MMKETFCLRLSNALNKVGYDDKQYIQYLMAQSNQTTLNIFFEAKL